MLCRTGSFTRTAKNLFLTQSAVSHSMKNLEEEAGCKLLRRQGKKVALTEAGDRLLSFVRPFLDEMENLRQELDGFEKFGGGANSFRGKCSGMPIFVTAIVEEV